MREKLKDRWLRRPIAREWPTNKAILIVPKDIAIKLLFLGET